VRIAAYYSISGHLGTQKDRAIPNVLVVFYEEPGHLVKIYVDTTSIEMRIQGEILYERMQYPEANIVS